MSSTFGFFQTLFISVLIVMMVLFSGDALATSDTFNDVLMIADAETQVNEVNMAHDKAGQTTPEQEVTLSGMNKGVWVAKIQGWNVIPGTIRRLGPPGTFHQPTINRAGTWVTFWGKETGKQGADIWIAATDGSHWQQLTFDGNGNEGPQWSPDGQLIVYSSVRGSSISHVWVMNLDGSNNRQLTFAPFGGARPTFHPDGNTIVFTSNLVEEASPERDDPNLWRTEANLWQTDLSGKPPVRITTHGGLDFKANFSPNGQYLAYHWSSVSSQTIERR